MDESEDQHHRRGRGGGRGAGDDFLHVHAEQQRDERRCAHEREQKTQHAAQVTSGVAVEMPGVSVASAAAGHHRAEFPKGQRAGQREQTAEEPHE